MNDTTNPLNITRIITKSEQVKHDGHTENNLVIVEVTYIGNGLF